MSQELFLEYLVYFQLRSFNIESLSVAQSEDETTSRMTIVTGDDHIIEQIVKQLDKLLGVIDVSDYFKGTYRKRNCIC